MQEDIAERPRVSTFISSMANYSNTIPAADDADAKPAPKSARMGTLIGVFLPCIQNIFGVILFIRLTWVVGTAGAICGFIIVLGCCCVVRINNLGEPRRIIASSEQRMKEHPLIDHKLMVLISSLLFFILIGHDHYRPC